MLSSHLSARSSAETAEGPENYWSSRSLGWLVVSTFLIFFKMVKRTFFFFLFIFSQSARLLFYFDFFYEPWLVTQCHMARMKRRWPRSCHSSTIPVASCVSRTNLTSVVTCALPERRRKTVPVFWGSGSGLGSCQQAAIIDHHNFMPTDLRVL